METFEERKRAMILSAEAKKRDFLRNSCNRIKSLLREAEGIIEKSTQIEYSGDFVLLKQQEGKWISLGVFNPHTMDEEEEPEGWDLCLPIPTLETVSEFQGF
tara:strand:- start:82 stop:387 length:306 start_codon:yes stop_codon:yes gene_type:complete